MTQCEACGRVLASVEEVHAMEGRLFCSKDCALNHTLLSVPHEIKEVSNDVMNLVEAKYNAYAEVVATQDILDNEIVAYRHIADILRRRDDATDEEIAETITRTLERLHKSSYRYDEVEDIFADELGLEMDYFHYFI